MYFNLDFIGNLYCIWINYLVKMNIIMCGKDERLTNGGVEFPC